MATHIQEKEASNNLGTLWLFKEQYLGSIWVLVSKTHPTCISKIK